VRQAIDDCRAVIDGHALRVRFEADEAVALLVVGDRTRLLQAVTTVIDHAERQSIEGGELAITARVASGDVVVRVVDAGRGIAPQLLPRIFEMAGDAVPFGAGALNLGLTLVKRLIELHDGAIGVTSEGLGKGTTFEIRLPLAPQDVEIPDLPQDPEATSPGDSTEPTMRMPALVPREGVG
jgi:signal transduction histidine kinase